MRTPWLTPGVSGRTGWNLCAWTVAWFARRAVRRAVAAGKCGPPGSLAVYPAPETPSSRPQGPGGIQLVPGDFNKRWNAAW